MTGPADAIDLRRLVDRAVALEAPSTKKQAHPLGLGLPAKKSYKHPQGGLPLPTYEGGLVQVREVLESRFLELDEGQRKAAWAALLANPGLVVPLRVPDRNVLLEAGIAIPPSVNMERVRSVGLAVVGHAATEQIAEGYIAAPRVAAVARVIAVLRASGGKSADDAWLQAHWTTATHRLVEHLELLAQDAFPSVMANSARAAALCVVGAAADGLVTAVQADRMMACAAVHGMTLTIVRRSTVQFGDVLLHIRRHSPRFLVTLGAVPTEAAALIAAQKAATEAARHELMPLASGEDAVSAIRDVFAGFVNVSPALHPVGVPPVAPTFQRPPMPVEIPGDCLHDGGNRAYVQDLSSGLWWTRDTAHHAGAQFKTYTEENRNLVHEACRTQAGEVMEDKYKGKVGLVIARSSLNPCGSGPHL